MKQHNILLYGLLISVSFLSGCISSVIRQPEVSDTICDILEQNEDWLEPVQISKENYGTPIWLSLALLEPPLSDFDKKHIRPRESDWQEYRVQNENWDASPDNIDDAVDFIGWFTARNIKLNQLNWENTYEHYLSLRLGQSQYRYIDTANYPNLIKQAKNIARRARRWQHELPACSL